MPARAGVTKGRLTRTTRRLGYPASRPNRTFKHRNAATQHRERCIDRPERRHPQQEGRVVVIEMTIVAGVSPELARLGHGGERSPNPDILKPAVRVGARFPQAAYFLRHDLSVGAMGWAQAPGLPSADGAAARSCLTSAAAASASHPAASRKRPGMAPAPRRPRCCGPGVAAAAHSVP